MIVECPRCSARYRVEEEVLKDEPTFKCSRCSHIFSYDGDVGAPPPSIPVPAAIGHSSSESLSFDFQESGTDVGEPAGEVSMSGDESEERSAAVGIAARDDFVFPSEDEGEDVYKDDRRPDIEEALPDEPRFVRGEDELRIEEDVSRRPTTSYLIFLALLALLYANAALYLRNHPAEASQLLARIPVAGPWLTEDRLLQTRIQLDDIEGAYQKIKDDRLVFIVSGRATNTSQQPLRGVQIESTLYDTSGKPLETKSIYCGNAMSLKIVKDLSSKEISLIQRLDPPQRFEIQPGESAGFTVVFMNPPGDMKEFSARVVSAHRVVS